VARRVEEITVSTGLGKFELAEGDVEALMFAGQVLAVGWSDGAGSVGQYFAHLDYDSKQVAESLLQIRRIVDLGIPDDVPLVDAMAPLLHLLPNGRYRLEAFDSAELVRPGAHHTADIDYLGDVVSYAQSFTASQYDAVYQFYPAAQNLMCIHAPHELDPRRVETWKTAIAAHQRPCIVTLGRADSLFQHVIDGHHKACAYGLLNVAPHVLAIYALASSAAPLIVGYHRALQALEQAAKGSPEYASRALDNFRRGIDRSLSYRFSFGRVRAQKIYRRLRDQGWREGAIRFDFPQRALHLTLLPGFPTLAESNGPVVVAGDLRSNWGWLTRIAEDLVRACRNAWGTSELTYEIRDVVTGEVARSRFNVL
jgi:hypothetical protein